MPRVSGYRHHLILRTTTPVREMQSHPTFSTGGGTADVGASQSLVGKIESAVRDAQMGRVRHHVSSPSSSRTMLDTTKGQGAGTETTTADVLGRVVVTYSGPQSSTARAPRPSHASESTGADNDASRTYGHGHEGQEEEGVEVTVFPSARVLRVTESTLPNLMQILHLPPESSSSSSSSSASLVHAEGWGDDEKEGRASRGLQILLCSHVQRDTRCGEASRVLRPQIETLLRENGDCGRVTLVSHLGGHKFAGVMVIYRPPPTSTIRRHSQAGTTTRASETKDEDDDEAIAATTAAKQATDVGLYEEDGTTDWSCVWYGRITSDNVRQVITSAIEGTVVPSLARYTTGVFRDSSLKHDGGHDE